MICKNRRCGVVLTEHYWGEGYCSRDCMQRAMRYGDGEHLADRLSDPTDATGQRAIAETRDEIDAMLEAASVDSRLPRIIYLRKRDWTYRAIGRATGMHASTCNRIIDRATPNLLQACGLRHK